MICGKYGELDCSNDQEAGKERGERCRPRGLLQDAEEESSITKEDASCPRRQKWLHQERRGGGTQGCKLNLLDFCLDHVK